MSKEVKVTSFQHFLYVEDNGQKVEIKEIDNPEVYGKAVTVYSKEAAKGVKKGTTLYAVSVSDFIPKKRASTKEATQSLAKELQAQGLSADEILARILG